MIIHCRWNKKSTDILRWMFTVFFFNFILSHHLTAVNAHICLTPNRLWFVLMTWTNGTNYGGRHKMLAYFISIMDNSFCWFYWFSHIYPDQIHLLNWFSFLFDAQCAFLPQITTQKLHAQNNTKSTLKILTSLNFSPITHSIASMKFSIALGLLLSLLPSFFVCMRKLIFY